MRETKNFNISVPELGDGPDITQVSNAISDIEDTIAGVVEVLDGELNGNTISLSSKSRTIGRKRYYEGLSVQFTAKTNIVSGAIALISIDNLSPQQAEILFDINAGDSVIAVYDGAKFIGKTSPIPRSDSVSLDSSFNVATSKALKTVNDKANDALNKANSVDTAFKAYCPYAVGDILTTTLSTNPATRWTGTTWQKIEGRYLKGTSGSEASKATGGSMTKTLSISNMPAHNHTASQSGHTHTANHNHSGAVDAHTHTANHNHSASQLAHVHTQPTHTHSISRPRRIGSSGVDNNSGWSGDTGASGTVAYGSSSNGGENTGSAQPSVTVDTTNVTTSSTTPSVTINTTNVTTSSSTPAITVANNGSGTAFNIEPSYYTVHYWLRTA